MLPHTELKVDLSSGIQMAVTMTIPTSCFPEIRVGIFPPDQTPALEKLCILRKQEVTGTLSSKESVFTEGWLGAFRMRQGTGATRLLKRDAWRALNDALSRVLFLIVRPTPLPYASTQL